MLFFFFSTGFFSPNAVTLPCAPPPAHCPPLNAIHPLLPWAVPELLPPGCGDGRAGVWIYAADVRAPHRREHRLQPHSARRKTPFPKGFRCSQSRGGREPGVEKKAGAGSDESRAMHLVSPHPHPPPRVRDGGVDLSCARATTTAAGGTAHPRWTRLVMPLLHGWDAVLWRWGRRRSRARGLGRLEEGADDDDDERVCVCGWVDEGRRRRRGVSARPPPRQPPPQ